MLSNGPVVSVLCDARNPCRETRTVLNWLPGCHTWSSDTILSPTYLVQYFYTSRSQKELLYIRISKGFILLLRVIYYLYSIFHCSLPFSLRKTMLMRTLVYEIKLMLKIVVNNFFYWTIEVVLSGEVRRNNRALYRVIQGWTQFHVMFMWSSR